MAQSKLERAYKRHEKKISELVENYQLYRRASNEMYLRNIVIYKLLKQFMSVDDIEKAINEYRSIIINKRARNEPDSGSPVLDGVGDEAGH